MSRFCYTLWAAAVVMALSPLAARAEITIGLATPLTGPYAWSGEHVLQGVRRAVVDLNEQGGVLGQPVEVLIVDDYCDPARAGGRGGA